MACDGVPVKADARRLHASELLAAETWFWEQAQKKEPQKTQLQRARLWCIFMLLRYAALRVIEITQVRHDSLDFANSNVILPTREIPLPKTVARRLKTVWIDCNFSAADIPLRCDPSLIRRAFLQCGTACGFPKGLLSARKLRWNRGVELLNQGIPSQLVDVFLGRERVQEQHSLVKIDRAKAMQMLREHIHKGQITKTSARNVFLGRIETLEQKGLLVKVVLRTAAGLRVTALITDTSATSLALACGLLINANIKAPWVVLRATHDVPQNENTFLGTIEQVRQDENVTEILVVLTEGSQVCALCANGQDQPGWHEGQAVTVYFSAFSVILTLV